MSATPSARIDSVAPPSARLLRLFHLYLAWYLPRHFHAVRIANAARLQDHAGPLVIYLNHASWWDPLTCMLLGRRFFPNHQLYAPMDAAALARYPMLGRFGLFPVEQGTRRGAMQFLRASEQILNTPNSALWITPQGEFTDIRKRPAVFKAGLAALIARTPGVVAVPLAIEYSFWDERLPEVLINVGAPLRFDESPTTACAEAALTAALAATQDALASLAMQRSAAAFQTIVSGSAGVGFAYDLWRRSLALLRGKPYRAEHTQNIEPPASMVEAVSKHEEMKQKGAHP